MSGSSDILYSYRREEDSSSVVVTSAGTEDRYGGHGSSVTMFHKDCYWIVETDSDKTKYVIDRLGVPSFETLHFAQNYSLREQVDAGLLKALLEEISQTVEGQKYQLQSAILKYKYRSFFVENCFGDCVSVAYPLIGMEMYIGGTTLHHVSYGGALHFSAFREQVLSLLAEETEWIAQADGVDTGPLDDGDVSSLTVSGYCLGTLLHEAAGHLLEYDHARSLHICKGNELTGPAVTVCEAPEESPSFGFCPCSDEGIELKKTVLVQDGVIENFLTSLSFSEAPYRHGRAQKCSDLPLPRNTSLSMENGKEPEDMVLQLPGTLYIHKKINPVLLKVEDGIPFFDVEIPAAYVVKDGLLVKRVCDLHIHVDFKHFFDRAIISSKVRGNQVGYCIKSAQQIESTQFAPDVNVPVENVQIHATKKHR